MIIALFLIATTTQFSIASWWRCVAVAIHATFPKELTGFYYPGHCFLATLGHDFEFDSAFFKVEHRVGGLALLEHILILTKAYYLLAFAHLGEKSIRFKRLLRLPIHLIQSMRWGHLGDLIDPTCYSAVLLFRVYKVQGS
jgi:hypothetical protein